MALTDPPVEVAAIDPPISIMAFASSMPKVSGMISASAVVPPSPGMAPNSSPMQVPITI